MATGTSTRSGPARGRRRRRGSGSLRTRQARRWRARPRRRRSARSAAADAGAVPSAPGACRNGSRSDVARRSLCRNSDRRRSGGRAAVAAAEEQPASSRGARWRGAVLPPRGARPPSDRASRQVTSLWLRPLVLPRRPTGQRHPWPDSTVARARSAACPVGEQTQPMSRPGRRPLPASRPPHRLRPPRPSRAPAPGRRQRRAAGPRSGRRAPRRSRERPSWTSASSLDRRRRPPWARRAGEEWKVPRPVAWTPPQPPPLRWLRPLRSPPRPTTQAMPPLRAPRVRQPLRPVRRPLSPHLARLPPPE